MRNDRDISRDATGRKGVGRSWAGLVCCLISGLLSSHTLSGAAAGAEPLRVIFDTDIDGDNDDVAAAAILQALADAGRVEILAMGVVSLNPDSPSCLDAINTYYGRGDIPIGVYKGSNLAMHDSAYAKIVAARCPNDLGHSAEVPDVLGVYRRVLAAQPDRAVTMIAVGQMNNLVDLLRSPPDDHSDLLGLELVRRKVEVLYVMAPYFNEQNEYQRAYNFASSPQAAAALTERWPTKIKFGEGNLGHRHFIGSRLSETPADNPARIAFEAYSAAEKRRTGNSENSRHCADPTTVLYAVGGTQYFGEVGPGACDVREDGFTRWNVGRDKQHFYNTQKLPIKGLEEVMEQLLTAPPKRAARSARLPSIPYTTYTNFNQVMEGLDARYPAMTRVSDPGPKEHPVYTGFFFYQCLQFDATGRFALGMQVDFDYRPIQTTDRADIGYVDLHENNRWTKIGETTAWNWQQGARLQWRPESDEIVWNDRSDDRTSFVGRVYNFRTGQRRSLPRPIYDLSPDGATALTHDFEGEHQGTHYASIGSGAKAGPGFSDTGIWKMNMDTGQAELIMPLDKMAGAAFPGGIPSTNHFYVFREGWNPSGSRFITFLKDPVNKLFEAFSIGADGTEVRYLYHNPSHHAWLDHQYIFDFGNHEPPGGGPSRRGYYLFKDDGSGAARELLWPVDVDNGYGGDGHGSFVPGTGGHWIISDTYAIHGFQHVFLFHWPSKLFVPLAKLKCDRRMDIGAGEYRVDTHPRLRRDGRVVSIDASHEGLGRQMYLIDIGHILDNPPVG